MLFERAGEESVPRSSQLAREYSAMMLLGREMEEMRWFLVPYEAHLFLTSSHPPPAIQVSFQPRDYENDDWYSHQFLKEWDKHWNPHYWEEVKHERETEGDAPVISHRWQWTIYPANRSPAHKVQLQPIRDEPSRELSARTKKAFASLEYLYTPKEEEDWGSMEHPVSPHSSGYSSDLEEVTEVKGRGKRSKEKRNRRVEITYGEDSRQGKKCAIM